MVCSRAGEGRLSDAAVPGQPRRPAGGGTDRTAGAVSGTRRGGGRSPPPLRPVSGRLRARETPADAGDPEPWRGPRILNVAETGIRVKEREWTGQVCGSDRAEAARPAMPRSRSTAFSSRRSIIRWILSTGMSTPNSRSSRRPLALTVWNGTRPDILRRVGGTGPVPALPVRDVQPDGLLGREGPGAWRSPDLGKRSIWNTTSCGTTQLMEQTLRVCSIS